MTDRKWSVMVTGGAGYVGSALVPKLLEQGHAVSVLDLYLYGEEALAGVKGHPNLREVRGDLRDADAVRAALEGCDAVIHLACISNDPSFELDPDLGKAINLDAFRPLVKAAKAAGVERFIYASSSSVYGIKEGVEVSEDLELEPLTDYSRFKAMCEQILEEEREPGFTTTTIRPATVCGYAPRQRLDVIINILTNHAVNTGRIKVMGGSQLRPNVHIDDMVDCYLRLLALPAEQIDGKIYNFGADNYSVMELAEMVRRVVGDQVEIDIVETNDLRSYHVSSESIRRELGIAPTRTLEEAVVGLASALRDGRLSDPMNNPLYFNIKRMQELNLT